MFLKTQAIFTNRDGYCNAYACQNKRIRKGERVIHTLSTYRGKVLSNVWHPKCHKAATQFAPYWDKLMKIQQGRAAMPSEFYDHQTGLALKKTDPRYPKDWKFVWPEK